MKFLLLAALLLGAISLIAQDKTVQDLRNEAGRKINTAATDTVPRAWRRGGIFSVNMSQGSLSNWAAGGDDFALSINNIISLYAFYKKDKTSWDNTLDFNYGFVRTTSLGSRKNDDRFDVFSKYGHAISSKWNAAALANFRTQFFKGFTYDNNRRFLSSNFLSPAYLLAGLGFDHKPNQNFSVYLSPVTARCILVKDDSLSAKGAYGVTPGTSSRGEVGAFLSANYLRTFNKTLAYKGRLDLFSNYRSNPQNVDVFMTNILSINFYKALSATWNVDVIYDDDVRLFGPNKNAPRMQLKSLIGIGLLLKLGSSRT